MDAPARVGPRRDLGDGPRRCPQKKHMIKWGFDFVCVIELCSEHISAKRYDFVCTCGTFGTGRGGTTVSVLAVVTNKVEAAIS